MAKKTKAKKMAKNKKTRNLCCDCCDCDCGEYGVKADCGCERDINRAADLIKAAAEQSNLNLAHQGIQHKLKSSSFSPLKVIEDSQFGVDQGIKRRGSCSTCGHRLFAPL